MLARFTEYPDEVVIDNSFTGTAFDVEVTPACDIRESSFAPENGSSSNNSGGRGRGRGQSRNSNGRSVNGEITYTIGSIEEDFEFEFSYREDCDYILSYFFTVNDVMMDPSWINIDTSGALPKAVVKSFNNLDAGEYDVEIRAFTNTQPPFFSKESIPVKIKVTIVAASQPNSVAPAYLDPCQGLVLEDCCPAD